MSTPPPRAGQTAADATGRAAGRDRQAPGPYGTGRVPADVPPPGWPERETAPGQAPARPAQPRHEDVNVVRSSGVMALGTLASRGTGFLRTLVLAYVLGVAAVSTAYNNANTLPNAVYDLMLGGILTSVVVPLLVNAAKRDADGGEAYDQRMFTLATLALAALTLVATLAAGLLVDLYAHDLTGAEHHLTVIFAFFFIPQIFFYGVSSLAGGVLNARGHFAAPMWTPVINNLVVIVVLVLFIAVGGTGSSASAISTGQIQLLGIGTTLGIVLQTVALIPFLRRVGFRWRPRYDFRRDEVAEIMRMAAPLFGYILTTQVSFLVVQNVANAAWKHAPYDGFPTYSYAWQLFQMPYAIVGISVITALLPRMSAHAAERRFAEVKLDFSGGVRLSSAVVVPASLFLLVLGAPFAEALFGYGHTSATDAKYIGVVFGIFSLGLVPYMMFQLMLRVFYAMHDSRTPMYIGVAVMHRHEPGLTRGAARRPRGAGGGRRVRAGQPGRHDRRMARAVPADARAVRAADLHQPGPDAPGGHPRRDLRAGGLLRRRRHPRPRPRVRHHHGHHRRQRRAAVVRVVRQGVRGHRADRTRQRAADEAAAMMRPGTRAVPESPTGNGLHGRPARASARRYTRPTMVTAAIVMGVGLPATPGARKEGRGPAPLLTAYQ